LKEARVLLLSVAPSSAELTHGWNHSVSHPEVKIGRMTTMFVHAIFKRNKTNFGFQTNKISNSTMKEAMTVLFSVAPSSPVLMQGWDRSVRNPEVKIGRMTTIRPCHFQDKKKELLMTEPPRS
jgi:hypothetical protein